MKRLGFFACSIVLVLSILWVAQPSTVFAQGIDRQTESGAIANTQGSYSYFSNQGIAILDATIKSLEDTKKAVDALTNEPNKATISATLAKNIKVFQDEKATYTASFAQSQGVGLSPVKAAIQANVAAEAKFQSGWGALTVQEKQEPRANGIIRTYTTQWAQLLTQAKQIEAGTITAGSAEANSLGNATAVSTAGESSSGIVAANDTKKCTSLFNASIVDCIDAGFAWLVKNTFLQIAGFLAWLAANMLNFAIQISVLDFAKWSPTSLYPIWVIIRQIVSLVVVFAGLYLGFMYIIGREDTFGKYIGWLAIFALFVNFSYPVTRALVDVSNIVSLNIYSSAVGSEALGSNFGSDITTSGGNTAGSLIMNRLGLTDLFVSATKTDTGSGFTSRINSTPGALVAVVFALYAAYVLFMATALLVMRAAVFAFLIVASPLLLVDAVVPKLGDVAVKMRKMFFEQLIVAPVFMIMLALTLKFMDVFQTAGGPLASGGAENVKIFFNILMMIVMLHIMLKVTKAAAGTAGEMATNAIGKVGGFGLGVASGGAGLLARGSVGLAAARLRDSGMMDKMQGSRTGRGLYSLTNSLAQSTFDTRNIGMVNRGMASAGMGMGKGTTQTYDKDFEARDLAMKKKYGSIKDASAREGYIAQKTGSLGSTGQRAVLLGGAKSDAQKTADSIKEDEDKLVKAYGRKKDGDKEEYLESLPANVQERIRNEGGGTQLQATKAEAIADEQRMNPTEEAKMMSAAEVAEMQKNFASSKESSSVVDMQKESFAERRKIKQAEAQRNIDTSNKNNESGAGASTATAPKPSPSNSTRSASNETPYTTAA